MSIYCWLRWLYEKTQHGAIKVRYRKWEEASSPPYLYTYQPQRRTSAVFKSSLQHRTNDYATDVHDGARAVPPGGQGQPEGCCRKEGRKEQKGIDRAAEAVSGALASRQDGIRKVPLDIVRLCGQLQVVGEGGEPLAAAVQSGRLCRQARGREVHRGQMWLDGLWRHGHGVI